MSNAVNISITGSTGDLATASAVNVMSASRGILAAMQQGIRLSRVERDLVLMGFATKSQATEQIVIKQDKPNGGWHPVFAYAATDAFAVETGHNPAELRAARLRPTHPPATVISSRHRSRLR
ncbi:hypothetical protein AB0N05_17190 [Nocardia sp. NPDC051030]|uniref:hypothetical protein n=1 Tax=Nocardia sp. NPDC051030 TaxID=3155162 RepID=UPI0034211A06